MCSSWRRTTVQVAALRRALGDMRVGTVDKFQGQEAPIVVYSMTSSSAEDAPAAWEFLYSLDRLNVATSRAQAVVVLVASPEIAKARCKDATADAPRERPLSLSRVSLLVTGGLAPRSFACGELLPPPPSRARWRSRSSGCGARV